MKNKTEKEYINNIISNNKNIEKRFNYFVFSIDQKLTNDIDDVGRKKNYSNDITYATNNELGFDYLRDNMKYELNDMVQRNHNFCIVDEVDSILIDESRTPL